MHAQQSSLHQFFNLAHSPKSRHTCLSLPTLDLGASPVHQMGVRKKHKTISSSSFRTKASTGRSKTRQKRSTSTQLIIDAGQSNFGLTKCQSCDMEFLPGDPEDEQFHRKYCDASGTGLNIGIREEKGENVLDEFEHHSDFARIVLVHSGGDCTPYQKRKTMEVRQLVDRQLGYYTPNKSDKGMGQSSKVGDERDHMEDSEGSDEKFEKDPYFTFMYILNDRVVGCLVSRRIDRAHRVVVSNDIQANNGSGSGTDDGNQERESLLYDTTETVRAVCGISRIWVHPKHRLQHIASRLLDACRKTLIYGYHVPLHEIAFSQPTTDGQGFATSYCRTAQFLVFTE